MTTRYAGTATIDMMKNGRYTMKFGGESLELIRRRVIKIFGKSTKRINKKRIKAYILKLVLESAEFDIRKRNETV